MKVTPITVDLKINHELFVKLLAVIHLTFFVSGIWSLERFVLYFKNYGNYMPGFSLYHMNNLFVIYVVLGLELIFLACTLGAGIGLLYKKAWGWYFSFIYLLIRSFKSLILFFPMFLLWCSHPRLMGFTWNYLIDLVVSVVLLLLLFDTGLQSLTNLHQRSKLVKYLFVISLVFFILYCIAESIFKDGIGVFS